MTAAESTQSIRIYFLHIQVLYPGHPFVIGVLLEGCLPLHVLELLVSQYYEIQQHDHAHLHSTSHLRSKWKVVPFSATTGSLGNHLVNRLHALSGPSM
jgi:hypothetical protein